MRIRFFFSLAFLLSLQLTAAASSNLAVVSSEGFSADLVLIDQEATDFPIFGKNKTSNKKQLKFAAKRSRRNGRGVMRARKNRGKNNGRSVKGGQRAKRGSKKKAGCNT